MPKDLPTPPDTGNAGAKDVPAVPDVARLLATFLSRYDIRHYKLTKSVTVERRGAYIYSWKSPFGVTLADLREHEATIREKD